MFDINFNYYVQAATFTYTYYLKYIYLVIYLLGNIYLFVNCMD